MSHTYTKKSIDYISPEKFEVRTIENMYSIRGEEAVTGEDYYNSVSTSTMSYLVYYNKQLVSDLYIKLLSPFKFVLHRDGIERKGTIFPPSFFDYNNDELDQEATAFKQSYDKEKHKAILTKTNIFDRWQFERRNRPACNDKVFYKLLDIMAKNGHTPTRKLFEYLESVHHVTLAIVNDEIVGAAGCYESNYKEHDSLLKNSQPRLHSSLLDYRIKYIFLHKGYRDLGIEEKLVSGLIIDNMNNFIVISDSTPLYQKYACIDNGFKIMSEILPLNRREKSKYIYVRFKNPKGDKILATNPIKIVKG